VKDREVAAYRIGEVARRAGMTTTALRAWERRYDVLSPARSAGGQRLYTDADVERVRQVRRLVETGWTVAAAAERARADVGAGAGDRAATEPPPAHPAPRATIIDALSAVDPFVVLAAYDAARGLLRAQTVHEVSTALQQFVEQVGGSVGPAALQSGDVLPVDLSFGATAPVLPRAPAGTLARMRLEMVLPLLVEDAREVAHRLGTVTETALST
jgi:DNA-binding transcriptional MerR regulator